MFVVDLQLRELTCLAWEKNFSVEEFSVGRFLIGLFSWVKIVKLSHP